MRCPFCSNEDTQVKDSRPADDNSSIRRRRQCSVCGARFTTFERVQLRELIVIKRNGEKSIYDRNKVENSMRLALRKRKSTSMGKALSFLKEKNGIRILRDKSI